MTCLTFGTLSGCASQTVDLPDWDIPEAAEEIQYPLSLPELPSPASSSETHVTFTADDFARLASYAVTAGGNYDAALANAEALERQSAAYNSLIEAGKLQRQLTQVRQEMLEQERRDHFVDNLWHRGIIVLIAIGVAL